MSLARSTIRTQVLKNVSDHSMIVAADVNTLIDLCHEEILNSYSWSRRKADTIVDTVASYSVGTVTTSGTTVTGSGTTFTSAMADRYIRISRTYFHRITAFTSTTSLTIEQALPADVTTATSYSIFRHVYDLPSTFGRVLNATSDDRLTEWSRSEIDRVDPYRSSTADRPTVYSIYGLDSIPSGVFQIEFWPVPSSATAVRIEFLRTNTLSADTDRPLYRGDVLSWRASESAAFFLHSRTGDRSWLDLADRYHARYLEALQGAKEEDLARMSPVTHIRFGGGGTVGDDYFLDRDVGGIMFRRGGG